MMESLAPAILYGTFIFYDDFIRTNNLINMTECNPLLRNYVLLHLLIKEWIFNSSLYCNYRGEVKLYNAMILYSYKLIWLRHN